MYEYLDGHVARRWATRLVLDVGGVGYDVAIPLGADFRPAPREAPARTAGDAEPPVRLWTHFVVREDAHLLFGFPDRGMRELFRLILKVRGVGPNLALAILSGLPEAELLETIAAGDSAALTRIKGIGKKTADQIILDLRGRAPEPESKVDEIAPAGSAAASQNLRDAEAALVSIGYPAKQAKTSVERAARKLGAQIAEEELETLVRAALRE